MPLMIHEIASKEFAQLESVQATLSPLELIGSLGALLRRYPDYLPAQNLMTSAKANLAEREAHTADMVPKSTAVASAESPAAQPTSFNLTGAATACIEAARCLHLQGSTAEALQQLNGFASSHPQLSEVWLAGGEIALSDPSLLDVAVDWTAVALHHHPYNRAVLAQHAEAILLARTVQEALPLWSGLGDAADPRALAARVLCEVALGLSDDSQRLSLTKAVNDEYVGWYRRLIAFGAESTVMQMHKTVGDLERMLPNAAKVMQVVISELDSLKSA